MCKYYNYALSFLPPSIAQNVMDFKNGITNKQISTPEKIVYDLYRKGFSVYKNTSAHDDEQYKLNCFNIQKQEKEVVPTTEQPKENGEGISVISVEDKIKSQSGGGDRSEEGIFEVKETLITMKDIKEIPIEKNEGK